MRSRLLVPLIALLPLLLLGCPDPSAKTTKSESSKSESSKSESSKTDEDPLEGSIFDKDELFAIFAAYRKPKDPKSQALLRKHRLQDASGQAIATRVEAYDRAVKRFAELDHKAWSAFVETLER
jgi:formiminotetrahydrofolate cyclodeaminase